MKINEVSKNLIGINNAPSVHEKDAAGPAAQLFERKLTDLSQSKYEEHIKDLTQKIFKQGQIVASKADVKELQRYREMVTELLNETVSNSYIFSKSGSFDSSGRHKIYAMVKKINSKMDDMTQEVLKEQSDNLVLLNHVDDIRGMLVDLFL